MLSDPLTMKHHIYGLYTLCPGTQHTTLRLPTFLEDVQGAGRNADDSTNTRRKWVPCSSFFPVVCMLDSTPTFTTNWDSARGAFISPCSRLSPAGAGFSDPSGYPTSPPTGPPVAVPTSPPTGPPTQEPTSGPTGTPTTKPTSRKCATNQSKRDRRRRRLMRSIVDSSVRSSSSITLHIRVPLQLVADRMRPRLLGGALQRHPRTIRTNPTDTDTNAVPPLGDDEDWYPLYVLEASRHQTQSETLIYGRDFITRAQYEDMIQDAWQQEFEVMDVPFTHPMTVIHRLLPAARECAESYDRFALPNITITSLTLEEALSHIRIVHQRIKRLTCSRKKIQRSLAKKYRQKRQHTLSSKGQLIENLLHELHRTRTAIVEHNERHQLLQRKVKALVKHTVKKMPRQVFVSLAVPPIPTYNRFQLLSEEDHTHRRTKNWTDFISRPPPQAPIGAVADPIVPIPLHQSPPIQRPMEAMAQLRRDLTTYGDPIAHQSPSHTHDVRGWYLTANSRTLTTLTVGTWNINGISSGLISYKPEYIAMIMQQDHIDVMICPDSRHTPASARSLKKIFVDLLGAGTKTYFSDDRARLPGDPGGITIIVGPRWGPSYISEHSRTDHSSHGVLTKIQLRTETGFLSILGTYWPERPHDMPTSSISPHIPTSIPSNSDAGTGIPRKSTQTTQGPIPYAKKLWPRILEYRKSQKAHDPDPILYLQNLALTWIAKDRADGCQAFILGGDLNSTWLSSDKGGQRSIRKWCEDNYFINGPRLIHDRFAPTPDPATGIDLHFITWGRTEWGWGTWIDHLLHAGDPDHISIHGSFNALGADLDDVSDHKPLWASYVTAPPAEARVLSLPKPARRPEIPRTDQRQIALFKTRISEVMSQLPLTVDTPLEAEAALEYATAYTVQLTREINDQFQGTRSCSHYKRGHSPEFMLRKWHLCAIIELKRHLLGLHGKTRWTSLFAIQRGIFYMFQTLEARAAGMGMLRTEVHRILSSTSLDAKYWLALPSGPTSSLCDIGIKKLKNFLHGRKRMDMRKASSGYSSWVESMREQGKIGRVIKATLGVHAGRRHQDGLTIDAIQTTSGRIQGNPAEIHELLTAHAQASFSIPVECNTPFHTAKDWKPYVDDINLFLSAFETSNIPVRYLHLIHKSLQPIPQAAAIHAELELLLAQPPTLEDFKKGIRQTKANSAPGPSGLTNNMTKSWPESMVTYIHSCLSKFWTSTTIPAAQKWKWLHHIPKKSSDTLKLSDLRPLMLIEVLRKHWCTHVATTIKGVLYKHKALEDAHHGYIAGRGTGTASILHINLSEDVEEKSAALHSSSFDLQNAFGSVLNPAIDWCQRRLGIPQEVTRFMASMDEDGTTVVKSSHAQHVWELLPYQCVHTEGSYPITAHTPLPGSVQISSCRAERGIGQGNPASPDQYLYHDDIIKMGMRLLDKDRTPTFAGAEDNDVFEQPDNGYADDMESASHSAELIQEKAELFSAFNLVLGLQFSPGKIRRLLQDFLPRRLRNHALHMTIYTHGWIPQHIPIATTGSTEYLGGIYDLDNSYNAAMEHMTSVAKLHCNAIERTHFSAESKILVATTSTVNKLRYTWESSSLSHEHALKIDAILDTGHVKATKNMMSYPRKLLHVPRYLGGLGIVHFSAEGDMGKLRKLFGCMRSQQKHGHAARGILSRLCRKMGYHSSPGQQIIITSRNETKCERRLYGDSPRQWLESHSLHLCRHGKAEGFDSISGLLPALLPQEASDLRSTCYRLELFNVSDLTVETSTGRQWWTSSALPEELRGLLPITIPTGQPPLLVGQYWKLESGVRQKGTFRNIIRAGDVIRVDGKIGDDVVCQLYQYQSASAGQRVKLVPGAIRLACADLFRSPFAIRCTLAQVKNDIYDVLHPRRQLAPAWLEIPDPGPPDWIKWIQQQLHTTMSSFNYVARPYTDGAYKKLASVEGYFRPELAKRLASAAIIIKDDSPEWKSKPVIAVRITDGDSLDPDSVYPMEFVALAGALQLAMFCPALHDIGSDAESILNLLPKRSRLLQSVARDHHYLLQCVDNYLYRGARLPYHVRGHAESRKPGKDAQGRLGASWNKDDWGNWIADRLAANDLNILNHHGIRVTHISIPALEMYRALRMAGQWYIGDIAGSPLLPKGLAATVARSLASSYYRERDEYRVQGGRIATWEHDTSMEHSAEVFSMRSASAAVAGTKSRVMYDKGYHGGNRAKNDGLTPEEKEKVGQCLLCGQPDSQDHWLHHCANKCMVRIRDDILADLNRTITSYRDINPLHRQLGFAFKHVLMQTAQPSRIWTANWSMEQILSLQNNFNNDLLQGLEMKDLRKILIPLERKLAVGALSLWHTKVCEERRHRPSVERPPRYQSKAKVHIQVVPSAESPSSPPLEATLAPRRPYLSRTARRRNRISMQSVTVTRPVTIIQFPRLSHQQHLRISRACHTDKSESVIVVVDPTNYGSHAIRGIEFQRICPNEKGERVGHGFFNDGVMAAYLALLQAKMPSQLKVASSWATLQLVSRQFDEVLRALRYGHTRRQHGSFGDQKWIFFIFNITDDRGTGLHFTAAGINTEARTYTYYDYAKMYSERDSHMAAVKDLLVHIDNQNPGDRPEWVAHLNGTHDMVTQGRFPDCGPGTCFIIEAVVSDIPLAYFTVEGIHQGRMHFAHCLLTQDIPPMSSSIVSTVTTIISPPELSVEEVTETISISPEIQTIFHKDYEYDPYCDDAEHGAGHVAALDMDASRLTIPSLQQHQIREILATIDPSRELEILRPSEYYPTTVSDLYHLILPNSITDNLIHHLLLDSYGDCPDILLFPTDMTRLIMKCEGDITMIKGNNSKHDQLMALQIKIPTHRFIIFPYWENNHFTVLVVDQGDASVLPSFHLTYLDSLKYCGDRQISSIKRFVTHIQIQQRPMQVTPAWVIHATATTDMIKQRPFRRQHECKEHARHIECGIYVILMVQCYFLHLPLSVLTPETVHQYRTLLAWQLLHPEQRVPLSQLIVPTNTPSSSIRTVSIDHTSIQSQRPDSDIFTTESDVWPTSSRNISSTDLPIKCPLVSLDEPIPSRSLRPRRTIQSTVLPSLPDRKHFDFPTNDPASLYTYASTSTIPDAGWGLFMGKPIGPSSPEDRGHIIGEYYGHILSQDEINKYMYAEEEDVKTGFMIFFQGIAVNAWDADKGCYSCMSALMNDSLDASTYNSEWVKEKVRGKIGIWVHATTDIAVNGEAFIEYGNLSFCRASLPISLLFKAVTHYWVQIMSSSLDREHWSRIPQARALFNSPYHTCKPHQRDLIVTKLQSHYSTCTDVLCTCGLQQSLMDIATDSQPVAKKTPRLILNKTRKPTLSQRLIPPSQQASNDTDTDHSPLVIAMPSHTNRTYEKLTIVKVADDLPGAGLGLYARAHFNRGDVVGIYENPSSGLRLTAQRIKDDSHKSKYAVEYGGLVRDAWDPGMKQPCCNSGYINDYHDVNMDNVTFGIHPLHFDKLLVIATKEIHGTDAHHIPFSMPYGGIYYCDDCHSFELQCKAIKRYNIDIYTSTEATDGDWTKLRNFARLCEIFPRVSDDNRTSVGLTSEVPASSNKRKAAEQGHQPQRHPKHNLKETQKRKRTVPALPPKDARQRTLLAYIKTGDVAPAARIDSNISVVSDVSMSCHEHFLCHDDFSITMSTELEHGNSSLALNPPVDSPNNSEVTSQEDNQARQSSIAPDNQLPVSADLSDSPMEYDKRFVFI